MRIHNNNNNNNNNNNISRFPRFRKAARRIPAILLLVVLQLGWVPSTEALSVPSQSSPSPSVVSLSPPSSKTKSADDSSWVSTTIQTSRRGRTILHGSNSNSGGNETEHTETSGTACTTSFACTHTRRSSAERPATAAGSVLRRLFPVPRIQAGLFLWYWLVVGNLVLPGALPLEPAATLSPPAAAAASCSLQSRMVPALKGTIVSTLWLGFVLAISGMEAWVKFRAPFCPRAMALDIGRTVFPALNAVETALCALCWQQEPQRVAVAAAAVAGTTTAASPLGLVVATIALALDVLLLTPALVHRGETIVLWHFRAGRVESGSETEAGNRNNETTTIVRSDEWEAELTTQNDMDCRYGSSSSSSSSSKNGNSGNTATGQHLPWHALYVVLECAKVLALGSWIGFLVASCLAVQ